MSTSPAPNLVGAVSEARQWDRLMELARIGAAVDAARAAAADWADTSFDDRAAVIMRAAELLAEQLAAVEPERVRQVGPDVALLQRVEQRYETRKCLHMTLLFAGSRLFGVY